MSLQTIAALFQGFEYYMAMGEHTAFEICQMLMADDEQVELLRHVYEF